MTDPVRAAAEALLKWTPRLAKHMERPTSPEFGEALLVTFGKLTALEEALAAPAAPTHQHRKGGLYRLVGDAFHTETGEALVVYEDAERRLWARPYAHFHDGRFAPLEPAPDAVSPEVSSGR